MQINLKWKDESQCYSKLRIFEKMCILVDSSFIYWNSYEITLRYENSSYIYKNKFPPKLYLRNCSQAKKFDLGMVSVLFTFFLLRQQIYYTFFANLNLNITFISNLLLYKSRERVQSFANIFLRIHTQIKTGIQQPQRHLYGVVGAALPNFNSNADYDNNYNQMSVFVNTKAWQAKFKIKVQA